MVLAPSYPVAAGGGNNAGQPKDPKPGAPQSPEGTPSPEFKTTVATKGTLAVRVASSPWSANILPFLTRLSPSQAGAVSVEKGGERPTTS